MNPANVGVLVLVVALAGGGSLWLASSGRSGTAAPAASLPPLAQPAVLGIPDLRDELIMQITSPAFEHGGSIPASYTCDGENSNPPLSISGVPGEAQSLVLIMDDPDVPTNIREDGMWDHWVVFDMLPDTKEIAEGVEPSGIHGAGTRGNTEYLGPCPPDREHRYFFKLYALDARLELAEGAGKAEVEQAMEGHVLEKAALIGLYQRS